MTGRRWLILFFYGVGFLSCKHKPDRLFSLLESNETGIDFKNILQENEDANVLNYTYFYNGGGVAIGDINDDGLPDILFTGNMAPNRLYLNKGNFKFEDITKKAGIAEKQGWCTGACMADINSDGKLDIYICRSADAIAERRQNLLYINNGDGSFSEQAAQYGLADNGYSTQAAFFDYDKDGDLDMFLINHSLKKYAGDVFTNPALRKEQQPAYASKLYRNDDGHFTNVSDQAGITSNVLSFGLGLAISDINNDSWPDVYVSNDFNEPDYLFINNGDGTFSERLSDCMDQSSFFSMGSDCADFNNDGLPDIITLDMLPEDNSTQKMHSGAENFDKFQLLFNNGFYYQYSRNMLHKNNGDGTFSEIGQLTGVSNTDWSWAPLFADFDNDGYKDLFITNGYVKDNTNMDFIKYRIDRVVKERRDGQPFTGTDLLAKMPSVYLPNYIFQNDSGNKFTNKIKDWGLDHATISSGAAYADLDNDGDMDLVINNTNEAANVYRNNAEKILPANHYLKIKLQGSNKNRSGIGAKVKLFCKGRLYYQEQMPERGFQSSVDPVLNFGIGQNEMIDSILVIWNDDKMQRLVNVKGNQLLTLKWENATAQWKHVLSGTKEKYFTPDSLITFTHQENSFNDFTIQSLLPGYLSRQGPCMAKADINKDGREDLFIGAAKGQPSQVFIQTAGGGFIKTVQPAIEKDLLCEDVAAEFFDADNDGDPDLYVGSGGYEFAENDLALQDRLYLNNGNGTFIKDEKALPSMLASAGCVKAADIDGDGDADLFVGGRLVAGKYPLTPVSTILLNDGKGIFKDVTDEIAPQLKSIGMVTNALWLDINNDQQKDLVIVGEWMPVKIFINQHGKFVDASDKYIKFPSWGWWNTIACADFDNDGDMDLVIGNCGENTQFKVSGKKPMSLYYKDFDANGSVDPILCYYIGDTSYPAASRDDITDQLPFLRKKFLEYHSYASATINELFTPEYLKDAGQLKATTMRTIYLENKGADGFAERKLPIEAQYSPVYSIVVTDVNGDGNLDMICTGNNAWTRIKFGRYRANHGMVFLGDGKNHFTFLPQWSTGLNIRGDVRSSTLLNAGGKQELIVGINDDKLKCYTISKRK
ncbi:MAG: VCBS repeat-containing protein [Ferruginibacter sp.]